jgi:hypothetical protein
MYEKQQELREQVILLISKVLSLVTIQKSVSYKLLSFRVGQSHDSFTLLSIKNVILFQHCQQVIQVLCIGIQTGSTLKQTWVSSNILLCVHE